ncbi:erythromycin esterase family protein [Butyricicoccus faecihominis]|uniref:erythromycin esterase family protein n=1 Tax=Butyricicoccus faecihominis TaxID=1712515 RepID=UPI002479B0C7|nr:erythromycin esterase family protein [Butyricicoccus faecihominis]MCQ5129704.1 erythromycin esterase family protein [Butyricicoccus faecihominis]
MKKRLIALLCLAGILLTACDSESSEEQTALLSYTSAIGGVRIPEGVQVVSLGESSHGTKEYHTMRKDVFAYLMEQYGCHTFILEAAFGACLTVNDYILGKADITAGEALQELGFWVYQTAEFEQLLEWMHDYNQTAPEQEKIRFYGVDMQEGDSTRKRLLTYLRSVAPEQAAAYERLLKPLRGQGYDYTEAELQAERLEPIVRAIDQLAEEMDLQREPYTAISGAYDFMIARECVNALREYVQSLQLLQEYAGDEMKLLVASCEQRDAFMAGRVETIRQIDGAQLVFLTAHNMHVARRVQQTEGIPQVGTMGSYLSDRLGDAYFAIGTAFCKGTLTAVHYEQNVIRTFSVKEKHPFIRLFEGLPGDSWYIDIARAKADARLAPYLEKPYSFLDIGAVYSKALDSDKNQSNSMYPRHPAVLADSWDGMLIFQRTHPTQLLPQSDTDEAA